MTSSTYLPVSEVIGVAAMNLGDGELRKWGRPAYESAAQRAVSVLFKDVSADTRQWECAIPKDSLIVRLPFGMTTKSLVMLFNGDHCDMRNAMNLFIKPGYYHKGGTGAVANNTGSGEDLITWNTDNWWPRGSLCWAGEHAGCLYLSPSCRAYDKLHITYSGIGIDCWGDTFQVPEWAREAIIDRVTYEGAGQLWAMTRDNFYRAVQQDKKEAIAITNPNGTWQQALIYWSRMDQKQRNDVWTATSWVGISPY